MNQILLKKLQNYVKQISVNQLKNVRPEILGEKLRINKCELLKYVNELHEERLLSYKYDIKCPECGCKHTIYESELSNNEKECDCCGEKIIFSKVIAKGRVKYIIDKTEILEIGPQEINFTLQSLETLKKQMKNDNGKVIELLERRNGMKIFIGSSTEAQEDMEQVAIILEELNHSPLTWQNHDVFIAGDYTYESLIKITEKVDAAIFIFKADDKTWYRDQQFDSVRDNVILEYGLFTGKLGRKKVIFICKDNPQIASDLKGITYLDLDKGKYTLKEKIKQWINNINS